MVATICAGHASRHTCSRTQTLTALTCVHLSPHPRLPLSHLPYSLTLRYSGLAIDVALRRLLAQFRLPGEAQKIDRIMEK